MPKSSFDIGQRVQVLWIETGSMFMGVIEATTEGGTFDILYDEKVQGMPCRERGIAKSRLKAIHVTEAKEMTSIIDKMLKMKEKMDDDDATECLLSSTDVFAFFNAINGAKDVYQLLGGSETAIEAAVAVLSNSVMKEVKLDFLAAYAITKAAIKGCGVSAVPSPEVWMKKGLGSDMLSAAMEFIYAATALLTVLGVSTKNTIAASEEVLERIVAVPAAFLSVNTKADTAPSSSSTGTTSKSGTKKQRGSDEAFFTGQDENGDDAFDMGFDFSEDDDALIDCEVTQKPKNKTTKTEQFAIDATAKSIYNFIGKSTLLNLTSLLAALERVVTKYKQHDKICILAYELCFLALKLDASSNSVTEVLDCTGGHLLIPLQKEAINVLRAIFRLYPLHRGPIVQELFPVISQVYTVKSVLRTFSVGVSSLVTSTLVSGKITMVLAATMTILQALVRFKEDSAVTDSGVLDDPETAFLGSLSQCKKLTAYFSAEFLKRCKNKDIGSDLRIALPRVIDELQAFLGNPEWPVAAIILDSFLLLTLKDLTQFASVGQAVGSSDHLQHGNKKDTAFTNLLLDILAAIGSYFAGFLKNQKIERNKEDSVVLPSDVIENIAGKLTSAKYRWFDSLGRDKEAYQSSLEDAKETDALTVASTVPGTKTRGRKKVASANITVDTRDEQAFKIKLGIKDALDVMTEVTSVAIDVLMENHISIIPPPMRILEQCGDFYDVEKILPFIGPRDLACQFTLKFLELSSSTSTQHIRDAFALSLALWVNDKMSVSATLSAEFSESDNITPYLLDLVKVNSEQNSCPSSSASKNTHTKAISTTKGIYSYEWAAKCMKNVLAFRFIEKSYEMTLAALHILLSEPSPTVRARVVKALSLILKTDPELILRDSIRNVVTERFGDIAISVREEAVKLVGSFVLRGYDISSHYVDGLLSRLNDKGVSVRKSVVAIFKEVLLHQPMHPRYTEICRRLLEHGWHPKEEETIREVVRGTFQQVWFLPPTAAVLSSSIKALRQIELQTKIIDSDTVTGTDSDAISVSSDGFYGSSSSKSLFSLPSGWIMVPIEDRAFSREDHKEELETPTRTSSGATSSHDSCMYISPEGSRYFSLAEVRHAVSSSSSSRSNSNSANLLQISMTKNPEEHHIESTAFQVVDVLESLPNTEEWLVKMIRDMLHGDKLGEDTSSTVLKRRQQSLEQCVKLTGTLVEMLLLVEERNESLLNKLHCVRTVENHVVATVSALTVFCKAHPPLLMPHILTLLPYLKCDNGLDQTQEAIVSLKIIEIVSSLVVLDGFHIGDRINEVTSDLTQIALKYGANNIDGAVSCLALIAEHVTKDPRPTLALAEKCFESIHSISKSLTEYIRISSNQSAKIQRCLIVFGSICEHTRKCATVLIQETDDIEKIARTQLEYLPPQLPHRDINGACYSCCMFALEQPEEAVQYRALQALCSVYVGRPRLILLSDSEGLIGWIFSAHFSATAHEKFLTSLRRMMLAEEERLERIVAIEQMQKSGVPTSKRVHGVIEIDNDATVAGFVLQQHLSKLLGFMTVPSATTRLSAVELIGTLLRQGMLCPLDALGHLVALQGDSIPEIRSVALYQLQCEDEKYSSFVDNRVVEGVELSYFIQSSSCCGSGEVQTVIEAIDENGSPYLTSVFSGLYTSCLQKNRKRRVDFIVGLLRRYEFLHGSFTKDNAVADDKPKSSPSLLRTKDEKREDVASRMHVIGFILTSLAYLPYDSLDEPLMAVHWINKIVSVSTTVLLSEMKKALQAIGASEREEGAMQAPSEGSRPRRSASLGAKYGEEPTKRKAVDNSAWEDTLLLNETAFRNIFKTEDFQSNLRTAVLRCFEARSREAVMRLKGFLKVMYSISDERCISFHPDEKVISEKAKALSGLEKFSAFKDTKDINLLAQALLPTTVELLDEATAKKILRIVISDYNHLSVMIDADPEDYAIAVKKTREKKTHSGSAMKKRLSSTTSISTNNSSHRSTGGKSKKKKRRTFALKRRRNSDDDEDDEDEDDSDEFDDQEDDDSDYE